MKNCIKLLSFCFTIVILLPSISHAQIFKKIQADGGDVLKDCIKVTDDIYTIDIGLLLNLNRSIGEMPCDLHVGIHVENINTTFYEPLTNLTPAPNNGLNINAIISTSFNGGDYGLDCENQTLTITVDLYCKNGDEFTPINVCTDSLDYSSILPMSEIRSCSVAETFNLRFCCEDTSQNAFIVNQKDTYVKKTKLQVGSNSGFIEIDAFTNKEDIELDIFTVVGQKVANTQFYFESDHTLVVKNENLNFGYYIVRITTGKEIQTFKFIHF